MDCIKLSDQCVGHDLNTVDACQPGMGTEPETIARLALWRDTTAQCYIVARARLLKPLVKSVLIGEKH